MKLSKASEILGLKTIQGQYTDIDIKCAYTSDLLSDVMGNSPDEAVLITIQAHKNTVAVAVLKDSPAIIICNNRSVPEDMIISAKDENIASSLCTSSKTSISRL